MRKQGLVLAFVVACGGGGSGDNNNNDKKDAAPVPQDAASCAIPPAPLPQCTPVSGTNVTVREIGRVSGSAVLVTSPPNDGRLFVLEQQGRIRIIENEQLLQTPFLDISNIVSGGTPPNEQGLLGLAFHPDFCNNRQFYVFYTTNNANIVAMYKQSESDPNVAETTGEIILSIPDFASNHNGGMIEFGRDGYLYIGTGDGGGANDPQRTAQNPNNLLGKILRIDVNTTTGDKKYGIPADNPFANGGGAPEVYVLGLRNPWRWSFDRETGDMYIGDVGQDEDEEVTVLAPGQQAGANLGWSMYEGTRCFRAPCDPAGMTMPQATFSHDLSPAWLSVIGGEVYRGSCFPDLRGYYFFTDYNARTLMRGKLEGGALTTEALPAPDGNWPASPTSIHGDARGELYLTNTQGRVYRIEATP